MPHKICIQVYVMLKRGNYLEKSEFKKNQEWK